MSLSRYSPRRPRVPSPAGLRVGRTCALLGALALTGGSLLAVSPTRAAEPGAARKSPANFTVPMAVLWQFTGNIFPNNPSAPIVTEDTAYFASGNRVYAVSLQTGAQKWRYPTENQLPTYIQTSPLLVKDTLYVGAGDGLYAVDAATGKMKWLYAVKGGVVTSPQIVNGTLFFSSADGRFYGVDAASGDVNKNGPWYRDNKPGVPIGADLGADYAVANGVAYYVTTNQLMVAVDLATASPRWRQRLDFLTPNAQPVISGESLYLATTNTLSSWRTSNGSRRWVAPLPNDAAAPPAVDADGNVYVITTDRYIYSVDPRGRGRWKQPPQLISGVITAPIVVGNLLIVGTAGGGLYAYDTTLGTLKWSYALEPHSTNANAIPSAVNIATPPVVSGDTLYVLSDDGTLTAFRHDAPDMLPPTITIVEPQLGDYLNGRPPFHIAAKITDDGSGVNFDTLTLMLDNTKIPRRPLGETALSDKPGYVYNPDTNTITYVTEENEAGKSNALADGHHTITISVKDWMGNTATKSWLFTVDDTIPRRARRNAGTNTTILPRGSGGPGGGAPAGKGNGG
jgi:outer membrane protein assembly factor BamB